MYNLKQVKESLTLFFKNSKEISGGIGKIIPYCTIMATGTLVNGGSITFPAIFAASSLAIEGITGILSVMFKPNNINKLGIQECFNISFHLLCHQSYAMAVQKILKTNKKIKHLKIHPKEIEKIDKHLIEDTPTSWEYDLDFSSSSEKLFNIYEKYFKSILNSTELDPLEKRRALTLIRKEARSNLILLMSTPSKPYDWIYQYVQLQELTRIRKVKDSHLAEIENTIRKNLEYFYDKSKITKSKLVWNNYRRYLKELPKKEIFGSKFGIEKLYVLSNFTYYRAGSIKLFLNDYNKDSSTLRNRTNLPAFLSHLISNRTLNDNLIFIFGEPGIGKTSFAQIFSASLANIDRFHPIYIPLQLIDPNEDILSEIEKFLNNTFLRNILSDLPYYPNIVFILDGFDELAQATRKNMSDFFRRLERFCHDQVYQNAAIIALGRDTLFEEDDILIPANTHVITLQTFEEDQIEEWCNKWNRLSGRKFKGLLFWKENEEKDTLHEIVSQPLLLYLMAKLEEEGIIFGKSKAKISHSEVFRHIINWCCKRHEELRHINERITLSGSEMRRFLRLVGFCIMFHGTRYIHINQLQDVLERKGFTSEDVQKEENFKAQHTFLSFPFRKMGESSWEFKHKAFGEYLAAEYIGEALEKIIEKKVDPDNDTQTIWDKNDDEVVAIWIELFAKRLLTVEVQSYLEKFLGCWEEFIRFGTFNNKKNGLERLLERCENMYIRFIKERDMELLVKNAREAGIEPTHALANYGMAILIIGSYCARFLSTQRNKIYFELERICPNGWQKMINIFMQYADFSTFQVLERLFMGCSLESDCGISFSKNYTYSVFFPFFKVNKIDDLINIEKEPRFSEPINLSNAFFYKTDLSNIELRKAILKNSIFKEANLEAANLEESIFEGANLESANLKFVKAKKSNFENANLSNAIIIDADFSKANLSKADLSGAYLNNSNFKEANLEGANFEVKDISNTNFSRVNFEEVDIGLKKLKGINLEKAILRGKILNDIEIYSTNLTSACLENINLENSKFFEVILIKANLQNAILENASLEKVNLSEANLQNAILENASLVGVNLSEANLEKIKLSGAELIDTNLEKANLKNADLSNAYLEGANLDSANLEGANLIGANLKIADLSNANLTNANLTDANLKMADFIKANLEGANLEGANFEGANLKGAYFDKAIVSDSTFLDSNLHKTKNNIE